MAAETRERLQPVAMPGVPPGSRAQPPTPGQGKLVVEGLNLFYGEFHALKDIRMTIRPYLMTAIIGPSGCGKSSLLRCFNRMNELVETARVTGRILLDGEDIMRPGLPLIRLRQQVGMVF